jgi:hypothetical protein
VQEHAIDLLGARTVRSPDGKLAELTVEPRPASEHGFIVECLAAVTDRGHDRAAQLRRDACELVGVAVVELDARQRPQRERVVGLSW